MKKVLSFVLVLAMVLGSVAMVFAADYKDAAAITNKEAVDVLSELKVLEGDANGFRPTDTLTRAEAAAIIARLVLGRDEADKLAAATTMFSDVPASHWAAGYINFCVSEGIIAGNGDGTFTPSGLLTVPAFTKMLLCALGYKADREGLVGSNWEASTASLAVKAGVTCEQTGNCLRETAALLGLKTLEADVVYYENADITVNAGGAQVVVGGSSAKKVESDSYDYRKNMIGDPGTSYTQRDKVQQLVEKVYGEKLLKDNATDDFERSAYSWTYKTEEIGKYAKDDAKKIYTGETTESVVNDTFKDYNFAGAVTYVNGANKGNLVDGIAMLAKATHDGRIVEVYTTNKVVDKVVIIDEFIAEVKKVDSNTEKNTYHIINGVADSTFGDITSKTGYGAFAKDDKVVITATAGKVHTAYAATKLTGNISSSTTKNYAATAGIQDAGDFTTSFVLDGTTYKTAFQMVDTAASKGTYDVYLDANGFAVYAPENTSTKDYLVVAKVNNTNDDLGNPVVKAQVILMDGTTQVVTLKDSNTETNGILATAASDKTMYAYSVSSGKYKLYTIPGDEYAHTKLSAAGIDSNSVVAVDGTQHYFTDSTAFYVVKDAQNTSIKITSYTGKQKITGATGNVADIFYVTNKKVANTKSANVVTAIVLTDGNVASSSKDAIYINSATVAGSTMVDGTSKSTYTVYINGVKTVVPGENPPAAPNFYKDATIDANGVYSWNDAADNTVATLNTEVKGAYNGYLTLSGAAIVAINNKATKLADDVVVVDCRSDLYDSDKITSMSDIEYYMSEYNATAGEKLHASVLYDTKDEVITYIYITGGTKQHTL